LTAVGSIRINDPTSTDGLFVSYPVSREELERYYEESQPPNAIMFAICVKENGCYIGNARLSGIEWINHLCAYGRLRATRSRRQMIRYDDT
jgi:RimJ/RimL family protein N-acetyltransferase